MTEQSKDKEPVTESKPYPASGRGFVTAPEGVLADNLLRAESSGGSSDEGSAGQHAAGKHRRKGWETVLFSQKGIGWLVLLALNIFIVVMHLTLPAFDLTAHGWFSVDYLIGDFHHASAWHLTINLIALDLIFLTFPVKCYGTSIVIRFMLLNYLTNIGIGMLCTGEFRYYYGISGALHGLFVLSAFYNSISRHWIWAELLLCASLVKILLENLTGSSPFEMFSNLTTVKTMKEAHLLGIIMTVPVAILEQILIMLTGYRKVYFR
ncbi:MAG: hypothetical protein II152_05315 [Succinivibrionaceae bacterium]|nr:hypothetical protein [Succinivibrionaceae bacterium]